ncbi:twin-arginine translocase subunit TatC [Halobacterium rubrum]|uniref:twin-arginine translocase subunit TatC n=1 Tax=Halobacterium TaxID=2239 RepID=UPI001EFFE53A|nr:MULTISPECIES: twin-arginine translocase subunit TatC [Halobacterium]MDH5018890.1 twin-arginine translocase subunit TatC [Halobacterium rubrum]
MAEEPDGGRDLAEGRPSRDDWDDLQSAVRRVEGDDISDDSAGGSADGTDDSEDATSPTQAVRHVADADSDNDDAGANDDTASDADGGDAASDGRVDWVGLQSAVEPAEDADSGDGDVDEWEWGTKGRVPPDLAEGESPATDPQLLADEDHQSDGPDAHDDVEGPTPASYETPTGDDSEDSVITADSAPEPAGTGGLDMDAPETDEEAPLGEHVEEMVKRLAIVIAIAGLVSVIVFPLTEGLITTIWNQVLPSGEAIDPRVYHPLELLITQLKVASLAGLVVALPAFVYESYAFMRPGLYENERRYYLASVPTSLVLAVLGVLFAFFIVLPYTMDYFVGYTKPSADIAFALGTTFNLILMVMGYLAVVFQIPLFIMLAIMLGVVTRRWLESRRLLFWAAFAGISFTFGAIDPTGVVPIIVAITMIALFEGTLALLRWTGN